MFTFLPMRNTIQEYAWGSLTAIAKLLDQKTPADTPQAELWMGAHPKAPSLVKYKNQWIKLDQLIQSYPEEMLGKSVLRKFSSKLPFLFKVLAAARPLSIQAHPNALQARKGFEHENRLGIKLSAANRNYKDDQHKPECLCALEPFWAMCGFRPVDQMLALLKPLAGQELQPLVGRLEKNQSQAGLKDFFLGLLSMDPEKKTRAINHCLDTIKKHGLREPAYMWIEKLFAFYPEDIGIMAPAVLNLVFLEPGKAVYLPPGQLHAYLDGVGIEIMANSDNVLRGGLTGKHIDLDELAKVVTFSTYSVEIIDPVRSIRGEKAYQTPADEFTLAFVDTFTEGIYEGNTNDKVQILLCTQGQGLLKSLDLKTDLEIKKGQSVYIPGSLGAYEFSGKARLFKAGVP